ncbi:hypothetical protein XELAEV_18001585mg [Xenopus laevis]|nr:hypothetical protein XELAEV_18001585mg [Xenopus laevis]
MDVVVVVSPFLLTDCGIPQRTGRIVGGKDAQPSNWPWQVSLWAKGQHICGGTLINDKWAVTAAHCFIENSLTAESVTIYLGSYKLREKDPQEVSVRVTKVINYPKYQRPTDSGDISLMELSRRVNFTKYIWPICLPAAGVIFPTGLKCWVTGWGQTRGGSNQSLAETLQEVSVPLIDAQKCNELYNTKNPQGALKAYIQNGMICAGYINGGKASCQGDSGGPVVCQEGRQWYLAGVVSFGAGCALSYRPGVNTLVTAHVDWIEANVPNVSANIQNVTFTSRLVSIISAAPTVSIPTFFIPFVLILLLSQ